MQIAKGVTLDPPRRKCIPHREASQAVLLLNSVSHGTCETCCHELMCLAQARRSGNQGRACNVMTFDLLELKGQWRSEYRDHYRGIYGDYLGIITRIHSPTIPQAPVSSVAKPQKKRVRSRTFASLPRVPFNHTSTRVQGGLGLLGFPTSWILNQRLLPREDLRKPTL